MSFQYQTKQAKVPFVRMLMFRRFLDELGTFGKTNLSCGMKQSTSREVALMKQF